MPDRQQGPDADSTTAGTHSADGTWIHTWDNRAPGPPVVISNGLGAPPSAWPRLADPDCGFHAVSWHHRGLGGSTQPADPAHITVEDHVDDLQATMDAADIDRAILLGWSIGVNVAFEFARTHPERVVAILAVCGMPGGAFTVLYGPSGLAPELREPAGRIGGWMLRLVGPPTAGLASLLPRALGVADRLGVGGQARGMSHLRTLGEVARAFSAHPWTYYSKMVLASAKHRPMDTSFVTFPVTVIAGLLDTLAAADDLRAMAARIPHARFLQLNGTHFLPLQYPDRLHDELRALTDRADLDPAGGTLPHPDQLPQHPTGA